MAFPKSQRKFSNLKLTRTFHYRHMGLWILLTIGLIVAFNIAFHLFVEERFARLGLAEAGMEEDFGYLRRALMLAQVIETVLFCTAIVILAKLTSHRIAGAFIRFQMAFDDVRNGNMDHKLRFRKTDRLQKCEEAFNAMMEALRARVAAAGPGKDDPGTPQG